MKNYYKKILVIAIPIMLSNLVSQLQLLIDKMFLGRLDITCMSAVGNATSPMWTTMSLIFSLSVGATILVSQAYGADEKEQARAITAAMFKYNNLFAMLLFLFWLFCPGMVFRIMGVDASIIDMSIAYAKIFSPIFVLTGLAASISSMLQVSQKTIILVVYGVIRSGLNIFLDYCMIFGHFGFRAMGVEGAALATLIAELVGDVIVLIYVFGNRSLWLRPSMREIVSGSFDLYKGSVKLGVPVALEDFAWNFGNLFLIAMLNQDSVEAAGIHAIVFGIECIPIVVFSSFGNATLTLSGYETGSKNVKGVWNVVMAAMALAAGVAIVNVGIFAVLPTQILSIFTTDKAIIAAAPVYLMIVSFDLLPKAGNMIIGSGIKGYGDPKWMLITQCIGTAFVIGTSACLVLILHRGLVELLCVVVADEILRMILNYRKLKSIKRNAHTELTKCNI